MSAGPLRCLIHPEREALVTLKVPCAPDGMIHLCGDCGRIEHRKLVFEAYMRLKAAAAALERLNAAITARGYREKKSLN